VAAICLGLLRKKINPQEMAHLKEWKEIKKTQHRNTVANIKLLFTHPKKACKKIGLYAHASNQKRRKGAIEYWMNCGDVIQRWFELWASRFTRFGLWISKPFRWLSKRCFKKNKGGTN
jgi:hypothetical protein